MSETPRQRRALSHIGGAIQTTGDADEARRLAHALAVAPAGEDEDDPARAHVHGFHSYPARMHPETAARLVQAFTAPGERVLDPFCGSGTVLVETWVAGRRPLGIDLNPLAVWLARCKTRVRSIEEVDRLFQQAEAGAEFATQRRHKKAGASRRFPEDDVALFEPHVLLELDSWRSFLEQMPEGPIRDDLWMVLSALLVKFSRKRGDTTGSTAPRKTAPGFVSKFFVRKTEDLIQRLGTLRSLLPERPVPVVVVEGDACDSRCVPPGKIAAIITSPPYAATYDYSSHHALRTRWLGLDASPLDRGELGSRSRYRGVSPTIARQAWGSELSRFIKTASELLPEGAPLLLLMADSAIHSLALRADDMVADMARDCGFLPIACASQARPHFHGPTQAAFQDRPRCEHAILLRRMR